MNSQGPSRISKLALALLLATVALLALLDWRLATTPVADDAGATTAAPPLRVVSPASTKPSPVAPGTGAPRIYREILARPLFDSTRRPPPQQQRTTQAVPPPPPQQPFPAEKFKLVGIIRYSGKSAQALVRTDAKSPSLWLAEGTSLGGWRLARIGDDHVDFTQGQATGTLKLVPPVAATATTAGLEQPPAAPVALKNAPTVQAGSTRARRPVP